MTNKALDIKTIIIKRGNKTAKVYILQTQKSDFTDQNCEPDA